MAAKASKAVHSTVDALDRQIKAGALETGSFLPSENELASSLGVSRGTVRRAIEKLVESGALVRRPYSRPVIGSITGPTQAGSEVHVWVSHPIADEKSLLLVKEISKGLRGANYRLVVREPSLFIGSIVSSDERHFLLHVLENSNVAGAIIERDPFGKNEDLFARVLAARKHLVFVDTPPPEGIEADFVGTPNVVAARNCVDYLQRLGHSNIWFIADSDEPPAIQHRIRGYWRAMKMAGSEDRARSIVACYLPTGEITTSPLSGPYAAAIKKNDYFYEMALRAALTIQKSEQRPTALIVGHDVLAFWLCAFLEGLGICVPRDLSVIGFDWLAQWDNSMPDILSSVAQDFEGFGRHAANLLLDRLNGEVGNQPRQVFLDAPLVVKSSTTIDPLTPVFEPVMPIRQLSAS